MRLVLILLFITISYSILAQSPEKGPASGCHIKLTMYHGDGTNELMEEVHSDVSSYHTGTVDTTVYTLEDTDSMTASFFMINVYIPSWPFHEELIYGDPVYDTVIIGYSSVGGGTPTYDRVWSFTDSAMFTFYFDTLGGNPLHVVKLIKQAPAALIEEVTALPISVFPNPASGTIYIQFPVDHSAELLLTDASGRQVKAWKRDESHTLDLSEFQSGNYLLRIMIDGNVTTFRVQKIE